MHREENLGHLWQQESVRLVAEAAQPLNFRTFTDLNYTIKKSLAKISGQYDFVVGLPRSGLAPAAMIALHLNIPVVTVSDLIGGNISQQHTNRWSSSHERVFRAASKLRGLVVDDSTNTGAAIRKARDTLSSEAVERIAHLSFLAVYSTGSKMEHLDLTLEVVPSPRVFEWNFLHHTLSEHYLVDLDGVLCPDGPAEHTDDRGAYLQYISTASPKIVPTYKLGAIVTSRLEKYRDVTSRWLQNNEIEYGQLIMLNLDTAERRRELKIHGKFKADVYAAVGGTLFVESDHGQASEIASLTGKPVYCVDTGVFFGGDKPRFVNLTPAAGL